MSIKICFQSYQHFNLFSVKFLEEELHDLFPDGNGDLSSENFTPAWFLLERHHTASFDDLRAGLSFLKRKVEGQKDGQISFLKV
jgi:exocyst complex component 2